MFRPWQHPDLISACTQSGWYHVDQGRSLRGPQCIQGVLTLTDCNESTGGLCIIPKSHLYHDELVDSLPTQVDGNFVPVPASFHVLNHPQILPKCQAGTSSFGFLIHFCRRHDFLGLPCYPLQYSRSLNSIPRGHRNGSHEPRYSFAIGGLHLDDPSRVGLCRDHPHPDRGILSEYDHFPLVTFPDVYHPLETPPGREERYSACKGTCEEAGWALRIAEDVECF
jgi:hypothetical protein